MKLIYTNENQFLVNNAKNILENHNIEVTLKNEFASGAAGLLAPMDTWVELWIINDHDEEKAEKTLAQALKQQGEYDWFCQQCQEQNDASFDSCWQCQTEKAP
ncbi:MAG: hypothetical protein ACI93V_001449 [Alteromonadaceae bacterium]|jgi:hypothetical protein